MKGRHSLIIYIAIDIIAQPFLLTANTYQIVQFTSDVEDFFEVSKLESLAVESIIIGFKSTMRYDDSLVRYFVTITLWYVLLILFTLFIVELFTNYI